MAQKDRSKEIWLIPKRVNLHQTICLIDGIIERKYDGTSWNPSKQNNLGVNLKKWGATKDGKNISPQAIRTLVASVPQYLGFLYINTDTTPNTICLTDAGKNLWENHKDELVKIPNLKSGKSFLISQSKEVLRQLEKLQITNPVIQKDCENIYVFPFRFMLKVLLKSEYLDKEEIAYFLFKARREDEVDLVIQEILNFRKLSVNDRKALIDSFKTTHIGNITLVKAASSSYFISLCQLTGIVDKIRVKPVNRNQSISAVQINSDYEKYVNDILKEKYCDAEIYDFSNDLQLWIEYIGNIDKDFPPITVMLKNTTQQDHFVQVMKEGKCRYNDLIIKQGVLKYPMFVGEEYQINIIDVTTGSASYQMSIKPTFSNRKFDIESNFVQTKSEEETIDYIVDQINKHCASEYFTEETLTYLNVLTKATGIDKTLDKSLRGAYLEYNFYKLLFKLKKLGVIDEVVWNGRVGKYGLPVQAPGGKIGTPDIVFTIGDNHFVLELTTIKSKARQFSAEGSSVPDHIRIYKEKTKFNVAGVFCAPIIHERNTLSMTSALNPDGIKLNCLDNKQLVDLLLTRDRNKIVEFLM